MKLKTHINLHFWSDSDLNYQQNNQPAPFLTFNSHIKAATPAKNKIFHKKPIMKVFMIFFEWVFNFNFHKINKKIQSKYKQIQWNFCEILPKF